MLLVNGNPNEALEGLKCYLTIKFKFKGYLQKHCNKKEDLPKQYTPIVNWD